jgi:predicted alpha/beta-hydrolase family hydrolase
MSEQQLSIEVPGSGPVSALLSATPEAGRALLVYAPGAGSSLRDPFGAYLAGRLAESGYALLRIQFPYMEAGRSMPDRNPVLEATWHAAIDAARPLAPRLVPGGRSMGGRIASQVVAHGLEVAGLALFAYPLHPPGRPDRARDTHLASLTVPTLFCSGTRDTFATPEELQAAASKIEGASVALLEGADHGFNVLKAGGRTRQDVWREAGESLLAFLQERSGTRPE